MSETAAVMEKSLEQLIYDVTRAYVYGRFGTRHDERYDWNRSEHVKHKEKIVRDAFLAVRSRTGADFVTFFTGTLCSVHQKLGQQGYLLVAQAFRDEAEVERVRTLTLLALAAA